MTFWTFVSQHPVWSIVALLIIASTVETVVAAFARRK